MKRYKLTPRARADLFAIEAYTADRWGPEAVAPYIALLTEAMERLTRFPNLGRAVPGYDAHCLSVHSHAIYYRRDPSGGILVGRILHAKQSLPDEL